MAAVEALDELEKEVASWRDRHPNIVLLLGAVRSPPAIVEEFCARGSLFSVLQRQEARRASVGVARRRRWRSAAARMCYLHNCSPPIIHRDLSPNLMVDRYFRVKWATST